MTITQPELEDFACVACGGPVSPETDRTYAISAERELCFRCSVERGGEYDDRTDRWIVPPRLEPWIELRDERY